jgi:hypothetical protein
MGIDAEDGGVGGHGPIATWIGIANSIRALTHNVGSNNLLVIGCGKAVGDNVTTFWNAVGTGMTPIQTVTCVNGAAAIGAASFAGKAIIAVASSVSQTPSGGLTVAEGDALDARSADIAAHVNAGGGLWGLSQEGHTTPYGYLGQIGAFTFHLVGDGLPQYLDITPTAEGLALGITNALDVCCWHDEYITFPPFLDVLATNATVGTHLGHAAAIGGAQVIIEQVVCSQGFWKNHPEEWAARGTILPGDIPAWGGGLTYLQILQTPPKRGDASLILAHQWIAAKLNTGAPPAALAAGEALLNDHPIGSGTLRARGTHVADGHRAEALSLAATLDTYNNSLVCILPLD